MRTLILALIVAVAVPARADDQDLARAHFITGRSYYDQSRYADALKEFQEAYRLSKRVGFLYNIGVCQEQLGHDDEALAAFEGYVGSVADPAEQAEVQGRIDRVKARLAAKEKAAQAAAAPTAASSAAATARAPAERPVWKRGWFWGVVAGAVVVAAAGVTVGVVLGTRASGPRTLADVRLALTEVRLP